jgi:thiol:disulfide interchange protein DsbA
MKFVNRLCVFFSLFAIASSAFAQHEGHDHEAATADVNTAKYEDLNPKQSAADMPPLVMEFFWYGCPHCYSTEADVEKWLKTKPAGTKFVRVPAILGKHWIPHAQAYYAAERLGVLDKIHKPLFEAIHIKRQRLFAQEDLAEFIGTVAGIDPVKVLVEMQSQQTTDQLQNAAFLARTHRLSGVPAFIVGGKYKTGTALAGNDVMDVVIELLEKSKVGAVSGK